jgi:carboxyl-terminal processing protease
VLYTFSEPAADAWTRAMQGFVGQGVRRLVIDLRDNGGGRVGVAATIAGTLAPAGAAGSTFTYLRNNPRNAWRNRTYVVADSAFAGHFERIAWITSRRTCSASEILIAGLRPYLEADAVGRASCGKPVGFAPRDVGDKVLSAVTFSAENRDGLGDWFAGLAPRCRRDAEVLLPYGDPSDPWVADALSLVTTGRCPSDEGLPAEALSLALRPGARAMLLEVPPAEGLATQTGLR